MPRVRKAKSGPNGKPTELHGHTYGGKISREYQTWQGIVYRCENPNDPGFHLYGGAGVKVCERWRRSFLNFLADMGPRPSSEHSIDRYPDPNGNYEPGNCRWATRAEQARNRRNSVVIEYQGRKATLIEWSEILGIPYTRLQKRLGEYGWSVEAAFSQANRSEHVIEYQGRSASIIQWASELGIPYARLRKRLENGWPIERAFTESCHEQKSHA